MTQLNDLAGRSGEWLRGSGPEADIVISSRIRLARNLADFPFVNRAVPQDLAQIEDTLRQRIIEVAAPDDLLYVDFTTDWGFRRIHHCLIAVTPSQSLARCCQRLR